jgi:hypothetical protein
MILYNIGIWNIIYYNKLRASFMYIHEIINGNSPFHFGTLPVDKYRYY